MRIVRYGVRLERLNERSAEMVREWRNDAKIKQHMFYTKDISAEQQEQWFQGIDNNNNFFFVIHANNKPVGLINISQINWARKTAQTGLFIYDDDSIASDIPVRASLAMLDIFFLLMGINTVYAKVKGDNKIAHSYNSSLGFVRIEETEGGAGFLYELSKVEYLQKAKKLRDASLKLNGKNAVIALNPDNKVDKWLQEQLHWAEKHADVDLQVIISNHP